jgi:hypothetical protein
VRLVQGRSVVQGRPLLRVVMIVRVRKGVMMIVRVREGVIMIVRVWKGVRVAE